MTPARQTRRDVVDIARGAALVAMTAYHLIWDLADFGFLPPGTPFTPMMRLASNAIATAFLALVGLSLALAHLRGGVRLGAFSRRLAILALAAASTTAATLVAEPRAPIVFGILHCIALASLLAAPLLGMPAFAAVASGVAAILAPRIFSGEPFDQSLVAWIGLGAQEPATLDWRPVLPWAGVVWLTLGVARLLPASIWDSSLMAWRAREPFGRTLAWLGRHSLAVYLAHQPVLFALLFVVSSLVGVAATREREAFLATCRPACVESGGTIEACARSCACVADKSIRTTFVAGLIGRLWPSDGKMRLTAEACSADAP